MKTSVLGVLARDWARRNQEIQEPDEVGSREDLKLLPKGEERLHKV